MHTSTTLCLLPTNILSEVVSKPQTASVLSRECVRSQPPVETELRESIRQVLQAHSDGILMKEFPDVFFVSRVVF